MPSNLQKYLFDYNHSQFIEYNIALQKLNDHNNNSINNVYVQNWTSNEMISPVMYYIAQSLESMYKHYLRACTSIIWEHVQALVGAHYSAGIGIVGLFRTATNSQISISFRAF